MKTFLSIRIYPVCIAALGLAAALTATSHAAISLTGATFTETFTTLPPATSWSTPAAIFGVDGGSISSDATADGLVGTPAFPSGAVTSGSVATQLTAGALAGTVAAQNQARHYSNGFVGTTPTGNGGNLLMVTLSNNTGSTVTSLSIGYDLGLQNGNVLTPEVEFAGHRVYWSLTGTANSWNPIGDFGFRGTAGGVATQTQAFSLTAPVAAWANGTNAFILWLDDNAATNPDGLYLLDNIAFTPTPEPTAGLLALTALGVFGIVRRRTA